MLDVRAPGLGQVTPDGKRLFFAWNTTGTPTVWRLDAPKGFPVQMTGGEDRTSLADITPDGKLLVLSRDHGGEEDPGLYLQPVEGGATLAIQHKKGSRAFYGFIQDDARTLWFRANDRQARQLRDPPLRPRRPARTRSCSRRAGPLGHRGPPRRGGRGDPAASEGHGLRERGVSSSGSPRTKHAPPALRARASTPSTDAAYAAEPGELLVLTNKLGEWRRLYRFREGNFTPVTPEMSMDVAVLRGRRARDSASTTP